MAENFDIVVQAFRDYVAGDRDAWWPTIDEDITLVDAPFMATRQVIGIDAYEAWGTQLREVYPDFKNSDYHFYEGAGGRVLVVATASGTRADGFRLLHRHGAIWSMRQGKFRHAVFYANAVEGLAALGPVLRELKDY
jgi:ketosteroid isomerase-like protein